MASTDQTSHDRLAERLEELLAVETFPPPEDFARDALLNDPEIYERAAADPLAWWEEQARALHWFSEWDTTLDDSKPPFYKWFCGGTINASLQLPGPPRRGGARRPRRAALARRGGQHARRRRTASCTATSCASPTRCATRASSRATSSGSTCR